MNVLQGNAVRVLTSLHDFTMGNGNAGYLQGNAAVAQQLDCRILQVLGECFWDGNAGINWFGWLQSYDPKGLSLAISSVVLNTTNVTGLQNLDFDLSVVRAITINWSVFTVFSTTVPINGSTTFQAGG